MKKITCFLSTLLMICALITSCNHGKTPDQAEFAAYVASYSQGQLHGYSPIIISLTSESRIAAEPGTEAKDKLISLSPEIPGKTYWLDERSIQFIPDKKWPFNTRIHLSVFLNKMMDVPADFHIFRFDLLALPLSFELKNVALEMSSTSPDSYVLKGEIHLSDELDLNKADDLLKLEGKGKRYPLQVTAGRQKQQLLFESDSIKRKANDFELRLSWNGSAIGSNTKGSSLILIPKESAFMLLKTEVTNTPEQAIKLWFSEQTDSKQNIGGIIRLMPEQEIRIERRNNSLTIYPTEELSGDFHLLMDASLRAVSGKTLENDHDQKVTFGQAKPQLRFIGKGTILAGKNKGTINFQAIGLKAVDVSVIRIFEDNILQFLQWNNVDGESELKRVGRIVAKTQQLLAEDQPDLRNQWTTYGLDLNKIIAHEPGALYRVALTFRPEYTIYNCGKANQFEKIETVIGREDLARWEDGAYYDPTYIFPDYFDWDERDNPCNESYYYYEHFASRNVLSSNIGLLATQSNLKTKEILFVATNLETAAPLPGAKIELYDYQRQLITSDITDAQGLAKLQWKTIKPFLAIAKFSNEKTYLKLDEGSALPYTRFDVAGNNLQEGMNAYLFGERGVYRPGDTIHLGMILNTGGELLPMQYPIVAELYNSRNQLVETQNTTLTSKGLCRFSFLTRPEAPTGLWTAKVKVGGSSFSRRMRVETVKPNRLKIEFDFGAETLYPADRSRKAKLKTAWLHGAKSPGLDLRLEQNVKVVPMKFSGYNSYVFSDPTIYKDKTEQSLITGKLDEEGCWDGLLKFPENPIISGKYQMQWTAYVTEPGGDFSVVSHHADYVPYANYLGIAAPTPQREGYLHTDVLNKFDIVQLNAKGKLTGNDKVIVEVMKTNWSWWWSGYQSGNAEYLSTYDMEKMFQEEVQLTNGKGVFKWKPTNQQWGNYFIRVSKAEGGHSSGILAYFDWPWGYSRDGRTAGGGAALLGLSADKERYTAGDNAIISFTGPANGKAFISIESAGKQLKSWWAGTFAGENHIKVALPASYSPHVYVHITLLQPVDQSINDLPIRTYGIINLWVDDPSTKLNPQLELPKEVNSGKTFQIEVSEKNSRPMDYFIAVVDEGLLDLTGFSTPDPSKWFNQKTALDLKSWDMFDFVLGAYGGRVEQVMSIGGDAAIPDKEKARQSRFTPVVRFIGPISLKPGSKQSHSIKIDNYIGSVRVMLIAASDRAYGSTSSNLKIKQPLMALATLPRLLRQNDETVMPVTVFSAIKGNHLAEVKVETTGEIAVSGTNTKQISFAGEGEQTIRFNLKASTQSGKASVKIIVTSGQNHSVQAINLSIENSNERTFIAESHLLGEGQETTFKSNFPGTQASQQATLEVTSLPPANLNQRVEQLIAYPYGCTEQIVSQAFAQLYLDKVAQLSSKQNLYRRNSIESTIRQLSERQLSSGSFSYWPNQANLHEWADVFATHFLVLAKNEGFSVDSKLLKNALKSQQQQATSWKSVYFKNELVNDYHQAYRLYVSSLAGEPMLNAMNRLKETKGLSWQSANFLASAYQQAGQAEAAKQLLLGKSTRTTSSYNFESDFGSLTRDKAIRAIALITVNEFDLAFPLIKEISETLNSNTYLTTQTTSYALIAWQLFARKQSAGKNLRFTIQNTKPKEIALKNTVYQEDIPIDQFPLTVKNTGDSPLHFNITRSGIEASGPGKSIAKGIDLQVSFTDDQGKSIDPDNLKQGSLFHMHSVVTNTSAQDLPFLALSQIAAASWEILNERLVNEAENTKDTFEDYRDDRVIHHFDLKAGKSQKFTLHLLATYEGNYLLPAQRCESMYSNEVLTVVAGRMVSVKAK